MAVGQYCIEPSSHDETVERHIIIKAAIHKGDKCKVTNVKISLPPQKVIFYRQNANLLTFC